MKELFACTPVLPLAEAKKLIAKLQKPGKSGGWEDWCGEGGIEEEFRIDGMTIDDLKGLSVPGNLATFNVWATRIEDFSNSLKVESCFLGGNDYEIPDFGGTSIAGFKIEFEELNHGLSVYMEKARGMRFLQRDYDECVMFGAFVEKKSKIYGKEMSNRIAPLARGVTNDTDIIKGCELLNRFKNEFKLLDESVGEMIEVMYSIGNGSDSSIRYVYDLSKREDVMGVVDAFKGNMQKIGLGPHFFIFAHINLGGQAWFEGEVHNVAPDAKQLLQDIIKENAYSEYDISYTFRGAGNWKDREIKRKKWKNPVYQELGTSTLENGAVAKVKLVIEKDGYVFFLYFPSDEDQIKFVKSKVFQLTKWHPGEG